MSFQGSQPVAIVATAQTQWRSSWSQAQHIDLIAAAVQNALKGSGLDIRDVDFVIDSGSDVLDGRSISNCGFLGAMGAHHKEESRVEDDGLWAAQYGVAKIASGAAQVGLIIAYSKPSESDVRQFYRTMADPFIQRPIGLDEDSACGLQAQRYLHAHQLTSADLAEVAVAAWRKANSNPTLELNQVPTVSEVLASPVVASPLTQAMMARPVDGAVVIVLANAHVARRVTTEPVWVKGIGAAMDSSVFAMRDAQLDVCRQAAQKAYARAGLSPAQMDLAETSATSAAAELMTLEALGLAEPGKAIELFRQGRDAAINASGGALPANPIMATGLVRLSEAAQALWGQRGSGAKSSRRAVVHASSGIAAQSHCVFVVEVERP
jgi:acetyl-CoA C-acetyltransferase